MSRKKQKFQARPQQPASDETAGIESFSFGDPVAITDRSMLLDCMECADNGVYFEPPISPYGISNFLLCLHLFWV